MSGLLKNIDKLVGQQVLSGSNRLILKNSSMKFNQASLYYDPSYRLNGLDQGHPYDCFSLSTISQALTYESQQFAGYLDTDKSQEVEAEIQLNQRLVNQCLLQAQTLVLAGRWSEETDTSAAIIYAIQQGKRIQKKLPTEPEQIFDQEILYRDHICPSILRNLKYLSHLNIVDITEGLVNSGYKDVTFWNKFLNHVETNSTYAVQFESVDFHAWTTNHYEYRPQPRKSFLPTSNTQVQLQYFSGRKNSVASLQRLAQQAFLQGKIGLWLPMMQREGRVKYIFDERDPLSHRDDFKSALKQLAATVSETKETVTRLLQIA